ncbi:MAG: hypothetical protein HKM24_06970, partial [Gammaproteobacteria bacterium]|nr:hypothetical protein [Gammaproteobacteria bacterium]
MLQSRRMNTSSSSQKKSLYAQDGVDVEEEASFSSYAGSICRTSYQNSPFVNVTDLSAGQFRGPRPFTFSNLPAGYSIEATSDGIGTKGVLIDAAKTHKNAAYDLVAMTASDITRYGGLPLVLINILDVVGVGEEGSDVNLAYKNLLDGLGTVCGEANVVALKGETAQMSVCLGSEIADSPTKFNWGATMIGLYHPDKMITGDTVTEGQAIIALKENGFRCNGISSVRKALKMQYGDTWWNNAEAQNDIRLAATPSVLYDTFINTLHGWYQSDHQAELTINAVVHLSGGALREKLANDLLFPRGLSANLNNLFEPPKIMSRCAKWRGIEDQEFYETWNGGQGMLLVVDQKDAERCVARAQEFAIEACIAGEITNELKPCVTVESRLSGKQ